MYAPGWLGALCRVCTCFGLVLVCFLCFSVPLSMGVWLAAFARRCRLTATLSANFEWQKGVLRGRMGGGIDMRFVEGSGRLGRRKWDGMEWGGSGWAPRVGGGLRRGKVGDVNAWRSAVTAGCWPRAPRRAQVGGASRGVLDGGGAGGSTPPHGSTLGPHSRACIVGPHDVFLLSFLVVVSQSARGRGLPGRANVGGTACRQGAAWGPCPTRHSRRACAET